jgi:transketolase
LSSSEDQVARFKAACWNVIEIDGHNYNEIDEAISKAKQSDKPTMIACKTTIGYGAPTKAGKSSSHGSPLGDDEISGTRANIGWSHEPFVIPDDILNNWRSSASRCAEEYKSWVDKPKSEDYERIMSGTLPANTYDAIQAYKKKLTEEQPKWATRKSSGEILTMLSGVVPELVGGSADLTGSNLTKTGSQQPVNAEDYSGSYIYYGIREHAMAAAMNGMALHGGFIPYGGTFLIFTDYCRPAMRLSALMKQRVVYVMTHDSIGLGEDGPTHQPIEHMASLRAMPNIYSFRPADAVETLECWQIALESDSTPSVLALTRQGLPTVRTEYTEENLSARGGYILAEADSELQVTIFASGSEIEIALDAKVKLEAKSIGVRVVSMPCTELFDAQDKEYKYNILCNNSIKVAVEAAINYGWERYIGAHGIFVGMESFGESAPADELYKHFGITSERVIESVLNKLEK